MLKSDSGDVKDQYGIDEAAGPACRNLTLNVILEWHKVVLKVIERRVIVASLRSQRRSQLLMAGVGRCLRTKARCHLSEY